MWPGVSRVWRVWPSVVARCFFYNVKRFWASAVSEITLATDASDMLSSDTLSRTDGDDCIVAHIEKSEYRHTFQTESILVRNVWTRAVLPRESADPAAALFWNPAPENHGFLEHSAY